MLTKKNIEVDIFRGSKITLKMKGDYFIGESQRRISDAWDAYIYDGKIFLEDDIEIIMSSEELCLMPASIEYTGFVLTSSETHRVINKQLLKGNILLRKKEEEIVVVNLVDVESFVVSILCNRFPHMTQIEYLKVQAVALRNSSIVLALGQNTDCSASFFEGFEYGKLFGYRPQDLIKSYCGVSEKCNPLAHDAVKDTEGLALVFHDTVFYIPQTLSCGGMTEELYPSLSRVCDSEQINSIDLSMNDHMEQWIFLGSDSYCHVSDVSEMKDLVEGCGIDLSEAYRWKRRVEVVFLNALLRNKFDINIGNFLKMEVLERGTSGAVRSISIVGDASSVVLKQDDLDQLIVLLDLPSRSFVIDEDMEEEEPVLEINGAGMGSAEGICNVGALMMAKQGKSMTEILAHYLPEYILEKQY